jgi:hypothetical protein
MRRCWPTPGGRTKLRRSHPALQEGAMATLDLDDTLRALAGRALPGHRSDLAWLSTCRRRSRRSNCRQERMVDWEGTLVAGTVTLAPVSATWYRVANRAPAETSSGVSHADTTGTLLTTRTDQLSAKDSPVGSLCRQPGTAHPPLVPRDSAGFAAQWLDLVKQEGHDRWRDLFIGNCCNRGD